MEGPGVDRRRVLAHKQRFFGHQTMLPGNRAACFQGLPSRKHQIIRLFKGATSIYKQSNPRITIIAAKPVVVGRPLIAHMGATFQRVMMGKAVPFREDCLKHPRGHWPLNRPVIHGSQICGRKMCATIGGIRRRGYGRGIGCPHSCG